MRRYLPILALFLSTGCSAQYTLYMHSTSASIINQASNGQNSTTNWGDCVTAACAGGLGNGTSPTITTGIVSPSVSGASMSLAFTSPASGNNFLGWWKPGTADTSTWIRNDFYVYLPIGVANYEFDSFIATMTTLGMFGHQCNTTTGYWQYANETSGWTNSTIACSLTTGVWHHLTFSDSWNPLDTSCSSYPGEHFGSVTIDGVTSSWGSPSICATVLPSGWTHVYGCQFQMDSSSAATLTEYVDEVNCWTGV